MSDDLDDSTVSNDLDNSTASNDLAFTSCATCGTPFEQDERYPVRTDTDDDGNVQVNSFCDEDCLEEWTG